MQDLDMGLPDFFHNSEDKQFDSQGVLFVSVDYQRLCK